MIITSINGTVLVETESLLNNIIFGVDVRWTIRGPERFGFVRSTEDVV